MLPTFSILSPRSNTTTHLVVLAIAGLSIAFGCFSMTLYVLNALDPDVVVRKNAKIIVAVLSRYHQANGGYPVLPNKDVLVSELTEPLARSAAIAGPLPTEPEGVAPMRYFSFDGKTFGLLLSFKAYAPCKVAVGEQGRLWWGAEKPYCLSIVD